MTRLQLIADLFSRAQVSCIGDDGTEVRDMIVAELRLCEARIAALEAEVSKLRRQIITRHLFPVVKLEDVRGNGEYWVRIGKLWSTCHAMYIHAHHDQIDEIRGPIPMPEEKQ